MTDPHTPPSDPDDLIYDRRVVCRKEVRPARFERATLGLEGRCSIQLS